MKKTSLSIWLRYASAWLLALGAIFALAACRRAPEPTSSPVPTSDVTVTATLPPTLEASPTAPVETQVPTPTASPVVETPLASAYPGPATPFPSPTSPYPGPPTAFPSPTSPYPGPATPFPSPTSPYPAASPGVPQLPSATAYPGPVGATPTQPPESRPGYPAPSTPTALPGVLPSPSPTLTGAQTTPLPTATQGVLRTRIRATDPRTFQLVAGQPQLVEFFAYWDPVSQSMAPVVHVLEDRYQERIRFVYLDIDDPANSLFKILLGSQMPPLFFLLDGQGNVVENWQGRVNAEDFEQAFAILPP